MAFNLNIFKILQVHVKVKMSLILRESDQIWTENQAKLQELVFARVGK